MAAGRAWLPIELFDAFGAGIYLLFGIIHLDLWARRRDRMGHLWLAGASASALLVDITGMLNRRLDPWTPVWMMALNTLGVAAATVCLFELVSSLNRATAGRTARALQGLVLVFAVVLGLAFPRAVPMVLAGCMVLLIWAMAKAFRAAREGNQDSGMVARGFMVLVACLVADILKDFHLVTLPSGLPLVGFIVLFLASARSLNDRFGREEEASRTDTLTGLANRRGFLEASDGAVLRSRRSGRPLSIILADVDRFKEVNDSLSHAAGDAALKALSGALRSALRAQDTVARWGGDEFIVLLPETSEEGALHVSESLRAVVSALRIDFEGARLHLTLSLGVSEHPAERSVEDTIAEADAALYQAKQEGRDRVIAR